MDRRPLAARDYVVSIEDGPKLLDKLSKVRRVQLAKI